MLSSSDGEAAAARRHYSTIRREAGTEKKVDHAAGGERGVKAPREVATGHFHREEETVTRQGGNRGTAARRHGAGGSGHGDTKRPAAGGERGVQA